MARLKTIIDICTAKLTTDVARLDLTVQEVKQEMSQIKVDVNLVKDTIVSNHSELLSEQASARQESTNGFGLILGMLQPL